MCKLCADCAVAAKAQIIKALELGYIYLWHAKLKLLAELTWMILRKPWVHEFILLLENHFERFRVVHDFEEIKALPPDPDVFTSLRKKLSQLREEARDYLVGNGMAVFTPPLWVKNNNPEEWWSVNDFEILCASYRHEVEGFLKMVSPYFPRGLKSEDDILELHTPSSFARQNTLVSELPVKVL